MGPNPIIWNILSGDEVTGEEEASAQKGGDQRIASNVAGGDGGKARDNGVGSEKHEPHYKDKEEERVEGGRESDKEVGGEGEEGRENEEEGHKHQSTSEAIGGDAISSSRRLPYQNLPLLEENGEGFNG